LRDQTGAASWGVIDIFGNLRCVLSAVLEGVLIVIAAIAILREAYFAFLSPRQLDAPWLGLAVNAAALAIKQDGLGY